MTEEILIQSDKRLCACNCGTLIDKFDKQGKERFYKVNHQNTGRKLSEETKLKISQTLKGRIPSCVHKGEKLSEEHRMKLRGSNNSSWKGDNVGYNSLHGYVNKYKPKPIDGLCEFCHLKPYRDLACVTGKYDRNDFNNFKYLCISCHIKFDFSTGQRSKQRISEAVKRWQRLKNQKKIGLTLENWIIT